MDQLLAYRASDPARKAAGLVLEVKGDFCRQVRDILRRHGREADYVEVSLDSPYRYNPLHNDLDAYALAYGIATLMTNLFGRGKEPFWQQASTNLVKFVILLHQVLDDYVTLFQVFVAAIPSATRSCDRLSVVCPRTDATREGPDTGPRHTARGFSSFLTRIRKVPLWAASKVSLRAGNTLPKNG